MRCEAWANARSKVSSRFDHEYPCPHPAKYRVVDREDPSHAPLQDEYVCGRHVRPALMDNGDSVRKPWIVTRLEAESTAKLREPGT